MTYYVDTISRREGERMKITLKNRLLKVLRVLPGIYQLQPETDYQALISHSPREITLKAWKRTGKQMRAATRHFEERHPDVRRELEQRA